MRSIIRQLSTGLWGKSVENVEIGRFFLKKGKNSYGGLIVGSKILCRACGTCDGNLSYMGGLPRTGGGLSRRTLQELSDGGESPRLAYGGAAFVGALR